MINQGNDVPNNVIAVFDNEIWREEKSNPFSKKTNRLSKVLIKSPKKRNWFTPHFYRCLPLTIGNQYGFIIKTEFDLSFIWNGEDSKDGIEIITKEKDKNKYPTIKSHFGSGILTVDLPITLRTPPGINLMTINPPNVVIPNITVMTGVIETDNLRRNFTFNLKIQMPNIETFIPAGHPLAAFIPIPRHFADSFELKYAEDIFSEEVVLEELQAETDTNYHRTEIEEPLLKHGVGKLYMQGKDVYGNLFPDHQKP